MLWPGTWFIFLAILITYSDAIALSSLPTAAVQRNHFTPQIIPTTRPVFNHELVKRLTVDSTERLCGTVAGRTHYCTSGTSVACAATILSNGNAYQYCSSIDFVSQTFHTTAAPSWDPDVSCPPRTKCCTSTESPAIKKFFFIASGYTITGYGCAVQETTLTFNPLTNLLNPASFSRSLANSSPSTSSIFSGPKSSQTSTGRGDGVTSQSASPSPNSDSGDGGLSSGAMIGVGVGVGAGGAIILISGIAYLLWRSHKRRKQSKVESADAKDPLTAHASQENPPHYGQKTTPRDHLSGGSGYGQHTSYTAEVDSGYSRQELHGEHLSEAPTNMRPHELHG